jgi:hypothetical protein
VVPRAWRTVLHQHSCPRWRTSMKETDLMEQLKDISANVNSWVAFAEAKNGALLALDSGLALAIVSMVLDRCMPRLVLWYFYSAIGFTVMSLLVALLSFVPQSRPSQEKPGAIRERDNLWFYGDIAQYDRHSYLAALTASLALTDAPENRLCGDLLHGCSQATDSGSLNSSDRYRCMCVGQVQEFLA